VAVNRSLRVISFVVGVVLCGVAWKAFGAVAGSIVVGIALATAYRHNRSRNLRSGSQV